MRMKHQATRSGAGGNSESEPGEYHPLDSVGYLVNVAARLSQLNLRRHIGRLGLNPAQLPLIFWCLEEDGLTQAELCERTHIEQPSVAAAMAIMERKGLIVREQDPDDRRKHRIHISRSMRDAAKEIHERALASNREIFSGLSGDEVQIFMTTLRKIIDNLEERMKPERNKIDQTRQARDS
jgi:DNA-binding MarR family transcriptional regulator